MIECAICKKKMKMITNTHLKQHKITLHAYKEKFPDSETLDSNLRKKLSIRSQKSNEKRRGVPRSKEVKEKISVKKQGKKAWNKGKTMSSAFKENLSRKAKARHKKWKELGMHPQIGSSLTEETKIKISRTLRNKDKELKELRKSISEKRKRLTSIVKRLNKYGNYYSNAKKSNVQILGKFSDKLIKLSCTKCDGILYRTIQALQDSKVRTDLCDLCRETPKHSREELEILSFCRKNFKGDVICGDRKAIYPLELDIYLPEKKLAIEYCGLYWHSELAGKNKEYHSMKMNAAKDKGIKLLTIFEDEYIHNKEIVNSRIIHALGSNSNVIYGRKCSVKEINSRTANKFLNENHIQGKGRSNVRYGLYYNDRLVSIMTFSKSNISRKVRDWEINRFCSLNNTSVIGAGGKLFKQFLMDFDPPKVITYADLRWGNGNFYKNLGFKPVHVSPPNYWYVQGNKRLHRYTLRKNKNDNPSLTEYENRVSQGYTRIWDCGHAKFIWEKK